MMQKTCRATYRLLTTPQRISVNCLYSNTSSEDGNNFEDPKPPNIPSDDNFDTSQFEGFENFNQWAYSQSKHAFRPSGNPRDMSILLFPGQGSQFVGMGKDLLQYPNVPEMFELASDTLGMDLYKLCENGPASELEKTEVCQPAVFVTSVAAIEKLKHTTPQVIDQCITAAGFSVGEITALVFAGSLNFEQGLDLIKFRAAAMQEETLRRPGGLLTVLLSHQHQIKTACKLAREYCMERLQMDKPICDIANYLYADCKVIGGDIQALEFIEKTYKEFGILRCRRLPVSGAFHTKLMKPAAKKMIKYLENVDIQVPQVRVHSNVTGFKYSKPHQIKALLADQLYKPVKWEQIMHILYSRAPNIDFPDTYEAGPGKQLGTILKKVNNKAFSHYFNVDV